MPQISPPERGQPIDIDYLYEIVNAINTINNQIVSSSNAESRVSGSNRTNTDAIKTSSLKIYANQIDLVGGKVDANQSQTINVTFPAFKYPPVVTVTPLIQNFKEQSKDVILSIENVTTTNVDIIATFKKSGQVDIDIHLIAIGQS
jgi:hypothetical protein